MRYVLKINSQEQVPNSQDSNYKQTVLWFIYEMERHNGMKVWADFISCSPLFSLPYHTWAALKNSNKSKHWFCVFDVGTVQLKKPKDNLKTSFEFDNFFTMTTLRSKNSISKVVYLEFNCKKCINIGISWN